MDGSAHCCFDMKCRGPVTPFVRASIPFPSIILEDLSITASNWKCFRGIQESTDSCSAKRGMIRFCKRSVDHPQCHHNAMQKGRFAPPNHGARPHLPDQQHLMHPGPARRFGPPGTRGECPGNIACLRGAPPARRRGAGAALPRRRHTSQHTHTVRSGGGEACAPVHGGAAQLPLCWHRGRTMLRVAGLGRWVTPPKECEFVFLSYGAESSLKPLCWHGVRGAAHGLLSPQPAKAAGSLDHDPAGIFVLLAASGGGRCVPRTRF